MIDQHVEKTKQTKALPVLYQCDFDEIIVTLEKLLYLKITMMKIIPEWTKNGK